MAFRVLKTRYAYEEMLRNPVFMAADYSMAIFTNRKARAAWCVYCLSPIKLIGSYCPKCHAPVGVGNNDPPLFIGRLLIDREALEGEAIYASSDVMTSKLSEAERVKLHPPEPEPLPDPPLPRSWFTKLLDFLQAGI